MGKKKIENRISQGSVSRERASAAVENRLQLLITKAYFYEKLKLIFHHHKVYLQWIPSHVNIYGDELNDSLAKEELDHSVPSPQSSHIQNYSEGKSLETKKNG
ncbi:hypothetical protein TNCV_1735941 [Trichonephila clavipes]|nr:hypothetical protein TNCV_1735941 [Trichonephila clavipes]